MGFRNNKCTSKIKEKESRTFDTEKFLQRAFEVTIAYKHTYKNSAYLRLCFLIFYFEIDICGCHEKKYPHTEPNVDYDYKVGYKKTEKEFFYDLTRSRNQKVSYGLEVYVNLLLEEIKERTYKGLFPDVKNYMKELLISDGNINDILSDYECFISFFNKMMVYLETHYNLNVYIEDDLYNDTILIAYSSYKEFYIDCLTNAYTRNVWLDADEYPSYIKLDLNSIEESVIKDIKYWNFIFENWEQMLCLCDDRFFLYSFTQYADVKARKIDKIIYSLYKMDNYSCTNLLLDNAEKYSYMLSFHFTPPYRNGEQIKKLAKKKIITCIDKYCFLFCMENIAVIKKLNKHNTRLLFRIACLAENTIEEIPRIDLEEYTTMIKEELKIIHDEDKS